MQFVLCRTYPIASSYHCHVFTAIPLADSVTRLASLRIVKSTNVMFGTYIFFLTSTLKSHRSGEYAQATQYCPGHEQETMKPLVSGRYPQRFANAVRMLECRLVLGNIGRQNGVKGRLVLMVCSDSEGRTEGVVVVLVYRGSHHSPSRP